MIPIRENYLPVIDGSHTLRAAAVATAASAGHHLPSAFTSAVLSRLTCIAASVQNLQAGLSCQRLRCRDSTLGREDRWTSRGKVWEPGFVRWMKTRVIYGGHLIPAFILLRVVDSEGGWRGRTQPLEARKLESRITGHWLHMERYQSDRR